MAKVADSAANSYEGIYVNQVLTSNHQKALSDAVYDSAAVKGVSLNLVWGTIETAKGVYDWTTLDREVTRAVESGKQISLAVIPNRQSAPEWLFKEGVQSYSFDITPHKGVAAQTVTMAAPWDPVYQSEYAHMMNALADHLKSIPGAYQAVSMVRVTGIGESTGELKLPQQHDNASYDAIWKAAGYTPDKVIDAWKSFAAATNSAFSDKVMGLYVANHTYDFPLIDNNGKLINANSPGYVDVSKAIVDAGVEMFGDKFLVTWAALGAGHLSDLVTQAVREGGLAGYQTNHFLDNGAGIGLYQHAATPTAASYEAMLVQGIVQGGGSYLEVSASDAMKFVDALNAANNLIQQGAGTHGASGLLLPSIVDLKAGATVLGTNINDHFVFHGDSTVSDPARIKGFEQGTDKIDLSDIDANISLDGHQSFAFIGTGEFSHHAGELRFTANKAMTTVSGDVDGDGKADFSIQLAGNFDLKKGDFIGAGASTANLPSVVTMSAGGIVKATDRVETFIFKSIDDSPTSDPSRIKNFTSGVDQIDLSHIDANQQLAGNQHFTFLGEGAFTKQAGQLHETYTSNLTLVSGDANGDGKADFTIQLTGHVQLTVHDFIL